MLLDRIPPADINAPGAQRHGRTALEGAAEHGRIDMVQFLLSSGAETSGEGTKQYLRAIRLAKTKGHVEVVTILGAHGKLAVNEPSRFELEGQISDSESVSSGTSEGNYRDTDATGTSEGEYWDTDDSGDSGL
jgi:ankyrin repeat protein